MALSRRSTRPRSTLLLLVLASVTIITLGYRGGHSGWLTGARNLARDAFAPLQSATTSALRPVGSFFEGAARYGSLQAENAKLRRQLTRLRATSAQSQLYQRQAAELHRLAHLTFAPTIPVQAVADVIAGSPSNFQDTVELDKGRGAGIQTGMPVVSGSGLVGRVVEASSTRATVALVTDPSSNTGVRYGSAGLVALATGQGEGKPLQVSLVQPGTPKSQLFARELMVTSGGTGDLYPAGIPVGTVASATLPPGALQEDVTITPVVHLDQLQFVSVLAWTPPPGAP